MPEEALKTAEKIKEVKGKRERERYTQWNADFQRIARGYKKVFIQTKGQVEGDSVIPSLLHNLGIFQVTHIS